MKNRSSSPRHRVPKIRRSRGRRPLVEWLEARLVLSTTWVSEGPAPINDPDAVDAIVLSPINPTSGAVTGVAASPTDSNLLYVATDNGGVWKTTNATASIPTFTPLTDHMSTLSIGSIAMQPGNQNVLYAGTADLSSYNSQGGLDVGIYKTTNAGASWTTVGISSLGGQDVLAIAPSAAMGGNLVLASTGPTATPPANAPATGVYRSTDGGINWTRRSSLGGLPNAPSSQVINDPGDTTGMRFYAAVPGYGVYLSSDGGQNWSAVNTGLNNVQASVRIQLAIHNDPSNNDVYASVYSGGTISGIFRSADMGSHWAAIGTSPITNPIQLLHGGLVADPVSPTVVYVSGDTYANLITPVFKGDSTTGTWTLLAGDNANGTNPHDDTRGLAFDASGNLLLNSDGGLAKLTNAGNSATVAWVSENGTLATNEFHSVGYDSVNHEIVGGAQDDGTSAQTTQGGTTWTLVGGGDGGNVAIDNDQVAHPGTSIRYTASQKLGGFTRTTYNSSGVAISSSPVLLKIANGPYAGKTIYTSGTVEFNEVYTIDAVASKRLVTATGNRVYESTDQGNTLKDLGIALTTAPTTIIYGGKSGGVSNPDLLYFDDNYTIYSRQRAGATPTVLANYPGGSVISMAADPNNYKSLFVLDYTGAIYETNDAGVNWTTITGNLGTLGNNLQTLTVYSTPDDSKVELLAGGLSLTGTQGGVFGLLNPSASSTTWANLGGGLANAIVNQLLYNPTDDVLIASTLGRGAWEVPNFSSGIGPQVIAGAIPGASGGSSSASSSGGSSSPFAFIGPLVSTPATGTPVRIKDINTTGGTEPVKYLTNVNGTIFFTQDDGTHGRELWKSDGTSAGTVLVKDIDPSFDGSYPTPLGVVGGTLYFSADDGTHGYELWKTDGTTAGTTLVKDIDPGGDSSYLGDGVVVGSTLFFSADDGTDGQELWKTDGTASGTVLVMDINPGSKGSYPTNLTAVGGAVYFDASDATHGDELWKSDGTAAGTALVKDINPGAGDSYPSSLTAVGSTLYFVADDGTHGDELWKSDGTAAGTVLVKDINPGTYGSYLGSLTAVGSTLYFSAFDGTDGEELWKSDGTATGTQLVADIEPGSDGSYPVELTNVNGTLFFTANDGTHGYELWKSDGTTAGTTLVSDIDPGADDSSPSYLTAVGGTLFFTADDGTHGYELWQSDGTAAGTKLVDDINPGGEGSDPSDLVNSNGSLYFRADDGLTGPELWRSSGGATGLVLDVAPGPNDSIVDTNPGSVVGIGSTEYFTSDDGIHGDEIWKTNGTNGGTQLLADVNPGPMGSSPANLTAVGVDLFFSANDGTHGFELWVSDGTTAGTHIVEDIDPGIDASGPRDLTAFDGALYFVSNDGTHGDELWRSDGTAAGTFMVDDIDPGSDSSSPNYLTVVGGTLFFAANDGTTGTELWETDGTEAGTHIVADINPGPDGSSPSALTAVGGELFFAANDGTHGYELWKSDGTAAGSALVSDINPGPGGSYISNPVALGGVLYFAANDGTDGDELWKSDGTAAGTVMVNDIYPGEAGSYPTDLTAVGGTLFFSAIGSPEQGYELWKTDGTAAGTQLVDDINPTDDSLPRQLTNYNGTLYFVADDGLHGFELWKSDGTAAGTVMVENINPLNDGAGGDPDSEQGEVGAAGPVNLLVVNNLLFFADNDGFAGNEPYALDIPQDVTSQVASTSSGLTYNRAQKEYFGSLAVANTSSTAINGGLHVVLHGVPASVTLDGATINVNGTLVTLTVQVDANGDIEILVPQADQAGLAAGASFRINLKWHNPTNAYINYTTSLLSDPLL